MKYRFTKSALAGLMAVSLAACGSGSTTSGTSAAGASAGADSGTTDVAYKDTFTYAIGGEPSYLDPGYADDSVTSYVLNQIYYPMYYIAEDGSMVAAAVKDEKYDEDTMTYTFTLRDDLKWSDGQPCVAGAGGVPRVEEVADDLPAVLRDGRLVGLREGRRVEAVDSFHRSICLLLGSLLEFLTAHTASAAASTAVLS